MPSYPQIIKGLLAPTLTAAASLILGLALPALGFEIPNWAPTASVVLAVLLLLFALFTTVQIKRQDHKEGWRKQLLENTAPQQLASSHRELIETLNWRAKFIVERIDSEYRWAEMRNFVPRFLELHKQHVDALERGNLMQAHEILKEIRQLSTSIELENFWTRERWTNPIADYDLDIPPEDYGLIVDEYASVPTPIDPAEGDPIAR